MRMSDRNIEREISLFIGLDALLSHYLHIVKYRIWCHLLEPFIGIQNPALNSDSKLETNSDSKFKDERDTISSNDLISTSVDLEQNLIVVAPSGIVVQSISQNVSQSSSNINTSPKNDSNKDSKLNNNPSSIPFNVSWFPYSSYLDLFLYNNDMHSALLQMGLIITTRMEIDALVEESEDIFIHVLARIFGRNAPSSRRKFENQNRLDSLFNEIENEAKYKWNWIGNELRSWLKELHDSNKAKFIEKWIQNNEKSLQNQYQNEIQKGEQIRDQNRNLDSNLNGKSFGDESSESNENNEKVEIRDDAVSNQFYNLKNIIAMVDLSHKETTFLLECFRISEYVNIIVSSKSLLKPKPHPQVYIYSLEDLNIDPKYAIAVEASTSGVISAKLAGLSCIIGLLQENPQQRAKSKVLVADHEKELRDETMQMIQEGALTVLRNFQYLKFEYLTKFLESAK